MNLEAALRSTSDALLKALDRLARLEVEKRSLAPGDPRLVELSRTIEGISQQVTGVSGTQRRMTELENTLVAQGSPMAPTHPIAQVGRPLGEVLQEWRETERALQELPEGFAEHEQREVRREQLRAEYRRGFEDRDIRRRRSGD